MHVCCLCRLLLSSSLSLQWRLYIMGCTAPVDQLLVIKPLHCNSPLSTGPGHTAGLCGVWPGTHLGHVGLNMDKTKEISAQQQHSGGGGGEHRVLTTFYRSTREIIMKHCISVWCNSCAAADWKRLQRVVRPGGWSLGRRTSCQHFYSFVMASWRKCVCVRTCTICLLHQYSDFRTEGRPEDFPLFHIAFLRTLFHKFYDSGENDSVWCCTY